MIIRIFAIFSLIIIESGSFAQDFQSELQKILRQPEYKNATVGINVVDLENGLPIIELNSEKLMIPASTLKIVVH